MYRKRRLESNKVRIRIRIRSWHELRQFPLGYSATGSGCVFDISPRSVGGVWIIEGSLLM